MSPSYKCLSLIKMSAIYLSEKEVHAFKVIFLSGFNRHSFV
uniref:Uncharacterized protein n=1 Tax=Anguilla anguilla TaxID=7936 RepID=A0A0E9QVZ2_ANGAN